ncbi:MAG: hypothetical protein N3E40_00190 [Dehalococcoidia bacterium]|nr:hypothetical protein [Dehalococcoidia bacterium]
MGILEKLIGKPLHEVSDKELENLVLQTRQPESVKAKRGKSVLDEVDINSLLEDMNFDELEI